MKVLPTFSGFKVKLSNVCFPSISSWFFVLLFDHDDVGNIFLRNVGGLLPECTVLYTRRRKSWFLILFLLHEILLLFLFVLFLQINIIVTLSIKPWSTGELRYSLTILNFGIRWRCVASFTLRLLYPCGKTPPPRYPLDRKMGGTQSRSE
jgi:hypothetical protein